MRTKTVEALRLIRDHGERDVQWEGWRTGVVTSEATHLSSGQTWINWRTADALVRAGIAKITGTGEECEVHVPAKREGSDDA